EPLTFTRNKVIFDYTSVFCKTQDELLQSELFDEVLRRFIDRLEQKDSPLFAFFKQNVSFTHNAGLVNFLINLFRLLVSHKIDEVTKLKAEYIAVLSDTEYLLELIEEMYNYWRRFERFMYMEAPKRSHYTRQSIHHEQFIQSNVDLRKMVIGVYRQIRENLTGKNPRTYRQLPAGVNMGMLLEVIEWDCPDYLASIKNIPFVRLTLMEAPLILYPKVTKRKGSFEEIHQLYDEMLQIQPEKFIAFPAKVGELLVFVYFHYDFISQGLSLCNLFEIAEYEEIDGKRPDIILLFGVDGIREQSNTVYLDDEKNSIMVGFARHTEEIDYFGYFKKFALTMHNLVMMKRNRLPIHGAMFHLKLKTGATASVVIVGDSGAGKSETLEAFRAHCGEYVNGIKIIFDDMGCLGIDDQGQVVGYGTEIGAFVRLDDLQPGYAYEEIDRSIFMNPDKTNARLIIPVTTYQNIVRGFKVDMVLYANNYENVTGENRIIEFFDSASEAICIFRSGHRLAKGTTDEKGIVRTYFANPFGPPQRKDAHEKLAESYFNRFFELGMKVGQIRTRLGIEGFEQEGPKTAALALIDIIKKLA
ncbi:MAG: phosphoenolpyruvate carboxykinase, partial [Nitrospirae bacterium]|nr:phosphoenolpyruvate carboxykinase [Nitrospirota bacterium]